MRGSDAGAGTVGAALAVPLALLVEPIWLEALLVVAVVVVGVWAAAPFSEGDPGWVVVDETAGGWLAVIGMTGWPLAIGWLVFRAADISKAPPGVRQAERLPGPWGVMADDVVAGLYGLLAAIGAALI